MRTIHNAADKNKKRHQREKRAPSALTGRRGATNCVVGGGENENEGRGAGHRKGGEVQALRTAQRFERRGSYSERIHDTTPMTEHKGGIAEGVLLRKGPKAHLVFRESQIRKGHRDHFWKKAPSTKISCISRGEGLVKGTGRIKREF